MGILAIGLIVAGSVWAQNSGTFRGQVIQPDGKILIWGSSIVVSGVSSGFIARLNSNGSRDGSFNFCGCGFTSVNRLLVQQDGKIVVTGNRDSTTTQGFNGVAMVRINADGSLDNSLAPLMGINSTMGAFSGLTMMPDGKIMAASSASYGFPYGSSISVDVRNPNGTSAFGVGVGFGNHILDGLGGYEVLPDGKFYLAIVPITYNGSTRLNRYNANGSVDSTWPAISFQPAPLSSYVNALDSQPNGDLLIGGTFNGVGGFPLKNLARVTSAGTVDATFVPPANLPTIYVIKVLPDGKILIADNGGNLRRLNNDGSSDPTFVPASAVNSGFSVDDLGRIVFIGNLSHGPGYYRMNPNGDLDETFIFGFMQRAFDFDGDGKADVGVFRPSNGNWYLLQSQSGSSIQNFGLNGDVITPGDFDGDGKTDLAIWRPSTGTWWYASSLNGGFYAVQWGQAGDIPLAEDFNGDGRADYVFFRPSNSTWHRLGSTGGYSAIAFGTTDDIPLVADMDGDAKADPTIYRPSTGTWWYASSVNGGFYALQWGTATDIPVPGDYDADGKTDPAYFRPSNGAWYIVFSGTGYTTHTAVSWGTAGDRPTPADYDGDGKTDLAIYRPSNAMWFVMRSTAGFYSVNFGLAGDEPTPNAFVP